MPQSRFLKFGPAFLFLLFFVFVAISNIFDWDHFSAAAESDLRSWMIWGEPPFWSYQFCGGVTRVGDPQAFGLSPLFLFHILLGSVWGWKFLVLSSAIFGFLFMDRIRRDFFPQTSQVLSWVLILGYIFGNSYLWHFHHGHLTFVLHYWVLGLCYYYLKMIKGRFQLRDALWTAAIAWIIFSAGFYHTSVFFGLPLAFACSLHLLIGLWQRQVTLKSIGFYLLAVGTGVALSSYKWLGVLKYQLENPRVVNSVEVNSILEILKNLFLPTYYYLFAGKWGTAGPWAIWEYSVFSWSTWLFIVALLLGLKRYGSALRRLDYLGKFPLLLALVSFVFYLGGDRGFYPFWLLNHYLLDDSVRVIGRFGHNLVFASVLLGLQLFSHSDSKFLNFFGSTKGYVIAVLLIAANFFSFYPTLYFPLYPQELTSLPAESSPEMRQVFITRLRTDRQSFLYEPVNAGRAVLNCYNPIARGVYASNEMSGFVRANQGKEFPFVEFSETPSEECLKGTYFTATSISVGKGCPRACFSLNDVSPKERSLYLLDKERKVYCTQQ